jgi:plastocyanin
MSRVRRLGVIALLMATVGLGAGCHHEGAAVPGPSDGASLDFTSRATVTVDDTGITPGSVHVQVGDAITVVNKGTGDHGLTSTSIDTGTLHPGESTLVFLTGAGRIDAYDRDHPDRRLTIEVVAQGT